MDNKTDAILDGLLKLNPMWYYVAADRLIDKEEKDTIIMNLSTEVTFTGTGNNFNITTEDPPLFIEISSFKEWEAIRLLYG